LSQFKPVSPTARWAVGVLASLLTGGMIFIAVFYYGPIYSFKKWAPEQPLPFSHLVHAGENEINCQYCHNYARRSEMAGLPAVSICMNCHNNLAADRPLIMEVADYFEKGKPIEWNRVYDLPDHVWFSHKRHVAKDIECTFCHGPVQTLEVQARMKDFKMEFCLNCHQENGAPTDCWTCHT